MSVLMQDRPHPIVAVTLLFNPNESEVYNNILSYIDTVDKLYIIDNSSEVSNLTKRLKKLDNVSILHTGSNIGVAKALNTALNKAHTEGFKWLLTMDQDTSFGFSGFRRFINDIAFEPHRFGAVFSPLHNPKLMSGNCNELFCEKEYVMSSANLVNVDYALDIGGYDENLFIDEVDHDFCFRLRAKGYSIYQHTQLSVEHTLGSRKTILPVKLPKYSADRLYYMTRNFLYLQQKHSQKHKEFFRSRKWYLLKFMLYQLITGDSSLLKSRMIYEGISDYRCGKMGPKCNILC